MHKIKRLLHSFFKKMAYKTRDYLDSDQIDSQPIPMFIYKNMRDSDLILRSINDLMKYTYDTEKLESIQLTYTLYGRDSSRKVVFSKKEPYSW